MLLLDAVADVPMAKAWSFEALEFRPIAIMSVCAEFALDATALCPTAMVSLLVDLAASPMAMPLRPVAVAPTPAASALIPVAPSLL
ncbi:hypothetical protein D3C85_1828920 [compost metagenome]